MKENSIEEDIKIVGNILHKGYTMSILHPNTNIKECEIKAIEHILSDYKRVLKENERYKKSDYETICLENNELREITDRIQSEYNDLLKDNFKLKNELETKRKEYQETYKDVREELKELRKENEELKNKLSLKQFDVNIVYNDYLEKLNEYERNTIQIQRIKDKIEEEKLPLTIVGGRKNKKTLEYGIKLGKRQALQELLEGREKYDRGRKESY